MTLKDAENLKKEWQAREPEANLELRAYCAGNKQVWDVVKVNRFSDK